jgi:hypothetical protein
MRIALPGALLMVLAFAPQLRAGEAEASRCDGIVGVWEYIPPSAPGHAIVAKQGAKYLGVFLHPLPEPYSEHTRPRATAEKAGGGPDLYSVVGAWELTCEGEAGIPRLRLHWLYSSFRPQDIGTEVVFELERAGSEGKWWLVGPDGKRDRLLGAGRLIK